MTVQLTVGFVVSLMSLVTALVSWGQSRGAFNAGHLKAISEARDNLDAVIAKALEARTRARDDVAGDGVRTYHDPFERPD